MLRRLKRFAARFVRGTCAVTDCELPIERDRLCSYHALPARLLAHGAGASLPKRGPIHQAVWALVEASAARQVDF